MRGSTCSAWNLYDPSTAELVGRAAPLAPHPGGRDLPQRCWEPRDERALRFRHEPSLDLPCHLVDRRGKTGNDGHEVGDGRLPLGDGADVGDALVGEADGNPSRRVTLVSETLIEPVESRNDGRGYRRDIVVRLRDPVKELVEIAGQPSPGRPSAKQCDASPPQPAAATQSRVASRLST